MQKIFSILSILFIFLTGNNLYAGQFLTNNYEIFATVEDNNVTHYKEIIDVNFLERSHGIYRVIPTAGRLYYKMDGELVDDYRFSGISNIKVNDRFSKLTEKEDAGEFKIIKVGTKNKAYRGPKHYEISYDYTIYKGLTSDYDYDLIYMSFLPIDWQSKIKKFSVNLILPKQIDKDKLNLYVGRYGSTKNIINLATITNLKDGRMKLQISLRDLPRGSGLSLFAKVPKDYFQNELTRNIYIYILATLGVLLSVLAFFLWFKFGRDHKIVKTVEFYPPKGMNPVEMSYIVNNGLNLLDMSSLFIYMANKGYLKISQEEKTKKPILEKIVDSKELNEEPVYIKKLYVLIFKSSDTIVFDDLKNSFWKKFEKIYRLAKKKCRDKSKNIYKRGAKRARRIIKLSLFIYIGLTAALLLIVGSQLLILIIIFVVLSVFPALFFSDLVDKKNNMKRSKYIVLWLLIVSAGVIMITLLTYLVKSSDFGNFGIIVGISIFICSFFGAYADAISLEGAQILGKILGFKEYLRVVEVDKLKKLVDENPNYFYDIIPYAYVLNLSDAFIEKFQVIQADTGYNHGMSGLEPIFIYNMMNNVTSEIHTGIHNYHQAFGGKGGSGFSSSGFSSGGFSGGGFGGGGGGSW